MTPVKKKGAGPPRKKDAASPQTEQNAPVRGHEISVVDEVPERGDTTSRPKGSQAGGAVRPEAGATLKRALCSCGWRATDRDPSEQLAQLRANAHRRTEGIPLWHKPAS